MTETYEYKTTKLLVTNKNNRKKMTTKNRLDSLIFVSCILAPYLSTIFLIRIVDYSFLFLLPTYLIALIGLIITTKRLRKAEQNKKKKNVFLIISISAVLTFFFTYYTQQNIADFLSFKWKENSLIEFVNNIKSYKKITTLSDEYENLNVGVVMNSHVPKLTYSKPRVGILLTSRSGRIISNPLSKYFLIR